MIFLSNISQLIGPNWLQSEKCSEFIEICLNFYFKYADLDFDVKNNFNEIFTTFWHRVFPKLKMLRNLTL